MDATPLYLTSVAAAFLCALFAGWDARSGKLAWAVFWGVVSLANLVASNVLVVVAT